MIGYMVRDIHGQLCMIDLDGTEPWMSRLVNGSFLRLQRLDVHELSFYNTRRISMDETRVICARMRLDLVPPSSNEDPVEVPKKRRGRPKKEEVVSDPEQESDEESYDEDEYDGVVPVEVEAGDLDSPVVEAQEEKETPADLKRKVRKYTRRKKVE